MRRVGPVMVTCCGALVLIMTEENASRNTVQGLWYGLRERPLKRRCGNRVAAEVGRRARRDALARGTTQLIYLIEVRHPSLGDSFSR
jgi:hypothetical protein